MRALTVAVAALVLAITVPVAATTEDPDECVLFETHETLPMVITEAVTCTFSCDHPGEVEVFVEYSASAGYMQASCGHTGFGAAFPLGCLVQQMTPLGPCSASFTTEGDGDPGICRFIPGDDPLPTYGYHARCYVSW